MLRTSQGHALRLVFLHSGRQSWALEISPFLLQCCLCFTYCIGENERCGGTPCYKLHFMHVYKVLNSCAHPFICASLEIMFHLLHIGHAISWTDRAHSQDVAAWRFKAVQVRILLKDICTCRLQKSRSDPVLALLDKTNTSSSLQASTLQRVTFQTGSKAYSKW